MFPLKIYCLFPGLWLMAVTAASAATYYFDADGGSDGNAGTSPGQAWQSLDMANNRAFQPGDQLLLQRGDAFSGKIYLNGDSGEPGNPIVIGAYGSGDLPVINAVGYRAGVHIRNARHIEVSDLEIHGDGGAMVDGAPNNKRYGVLIDASGTGTSFGNISVSDLYIHDIFPRDSDGSEGARPNPAYDPNDPANSDKAITWYGTGIAIFGVNTAISSEVLVEGCRIETVGYKAIDMKWVDQIAILDNHMADIGGPAIQPSRVNDLVVRGNVVNGSGSYSDPRMHGRGSGIWPWGSERVLIEKNTFMHARGRADSCGIHIDFNCRDVVVQYNLSIDNGGGFIEILGNNHNCAYRYNISINDGHRVKGEPSNGPGTLANGGDGHVVWVSGYVGSGNPYSGPFNSYLYNTTIYVKGDITSTFSIQETTDGLLIANNIFYLEGPTKDVTGGSFNDYTQAMAGRVLWYNNLYQRTGIVPVFNLDLFTDTAPVIGSPLFANPGGLVPEDYIPAATALVEDKGIEIQPIPGDATGLAIGLPVGVDFFGSPILGAPDMGAIEIGGTPSLLPAAAFAEAPAFQEAASAHMASVEGPYGTEYYFTEVTGNYGGNDSGWQYSPVFIDHGLLPNTTYTYTVTLRNALYGTGTPSAALSLTTPRNNPYVDPLILAEDFSANPNPANATAPYPVGTWHVALDPEEQDASVMTVAGGQLRVGWGYDTVTVVWQSNQTWNLARGYRLTGDWMVENVLEQHLGLAAGVAAFDAATGERVLVVKEQVLGDLFAPAIGQAGSFTIDVSAAELAAAGVTASMRTGLYFTHMGTPSPTRNDVYLIDNLRFVMLSQEADFDGDGIPDFAESDLGLDPANSADGSADRDGDGRTNFEEYLTGTGLNDPADWFTAAMVVTAGQAGLTVSGASVLAGRLYILEHSSTLQSWSAVEAVGGSSHGPGTDLSFSLNSPMAREFFRVRVEWE